MKDWSGTHCAPLRPPAANICCAPVRNRYRIICCPTDDDDHCSICARRLFLFLASRFVFILGARANQIR